MRGWVVHRSTNRAHGPGRIRVMVRVPSGRRDYPPIGGLNYLINIFMNPHFQARGRGTGQLCLPYPHPDLSEANVRFQASSKHPELRLRKILLVPFKYSVFTVSSDFDLVATP